MGASFFVLKKPTPTIRKASITTHFAVTLEYDYVPTTYITLNKFTHTLLTYGVGISSTQSHEERIDVMDFHV